MIYVAIFCFISIMVIITTMEYIQRGKFVEPTAEMYLTAGILSIIPIVNLVSVLAIFVLAIQTFFEKE